MKNIAQKGFSSIVIVLLILAGIGIGIYGVQYGGFGLNSQASNARVKFVDKSGKEIKKTDNLDVNVQLNSPWYVEPFINEGPTCIPVPYCITGDCNVPEPEEGWCIDDGEKCKSPEPPKCEEGLTELVTYGDPGMGVCPIYEYECINPSELNSISDNSKEVAEKIHRNKSKNTKKPKPINTKEYTKQIVLSESPNFKQNTIILEAPFNIDPSGNVAANYTFSNSTAINKNGVKKFLFAKFISYKGNTKKGSGSIRITISELPPIVDGCNTNPDSCGAGKSCSAAAQCPACDPKKGPCPARPCQVEFKCVEDSYAVECNPKISTVPKTQCKPGYECISEESGGICRPVQEEADLTCGGIAGIECPTGYTCQNPPSHGKSPVISDQMGKCRKNPKDGVACTDDVQECSDGSFVGRTGPNCEFSACP